MREVLTPKLDSVTILMKLTLGLSCLKTPGRQRSVAPRMQALTSSSAASAEPAPVDPDATPAAAQLRTQERCTLGT